MATGVADDLVKDGTDKSFMADVIEASRSQPVIVDFWAPWCGPCRTLGPALEKAVRGAKGAVRMVKINIDDNPAIAGQLGVRSIPAVYAFDKGRPVDGFVGALPESQLKMFVDRLGGADMGDDVEELIAQAQESLKLGDIGGAAQGFAAVLQLDPENVKAIAGLARCYLQSGEPDQARDTLSMVPQGKENDADVAGVRAALELADAAPQAGSAEALAQKVAADTKDHATRFDLAAALSARGDLAGAVDHLLEIIRQDREWNEQAARKQLIKIFEAAGLNSDLAKEGRRRLSAIWLS
jgi:putative thioredoxin